MVFWNFKGEIREVRWIKVTIDITQSLSRLTLNHLLPFDIPMVIAFSTHKLSFGSVWTRQTKPIWGQINDSLIRPPNGWSKDRNPGWEGQRKFFQGSWPDRRLVLGCVSVDSMTLRGANQELGKLSLVIRRQTHQHSPFKIRTLERRK